MKVKYGGNWREHRAEALQGCTPESGSTVGNQGGQNWIVLCGTRCSWGPKYSKSKSVNDWNKAQVGLTSSRFQIFSMFVTFPCYSLNLVVSNLLIFNFVNSNQVLMHSSSITFSKDSCLISPAGVDIFHLWNIIAFISTSKHMTYSY